MLKADTGRGPSRLPTQLFKVVANEHDTTGFLSAPAVLDESRYPFRIPDWLWRDARRSAALDAYHRAVVDAKIGMFGLLSDGNHADEADAQEAEILSILNRAFSIKDLCAEGDVFRARNSNLALNLQLDPDFTDRAKSTIRAAIPMLLDHALDESVVSEAFEQSIPEPQPMPVKYETNEDGTTKSDDLGHPIFTDSYRLFLSAVSKPAAPELFVQELRDALSPRDGVPPLLVISKYSGNVWWGRSYYHYFHDGRTQLTRVAPPRGFFYIALNADNLSEGVRHSGDAAFWASKIGHECLHSLSYWHPGYKDAAERDVHNPPGQRAFIVAYEFALFEAASRRQ